MSRSFIVAGFVALASVAQAQTTCARPDPAAPWVKAQQTAAGELPDSWSNDSLRTALMTAANVAGVLSPQLGWALKIDGVTPISNIETLDYLKKLGSTRGSVWPLRSVVGAGGVRAVFFLAQRDTALLRMALKRMMEGGPEEGLKPDIAMLEDRARLINGRKQLYGTQMNLVNGRMYPLAIEDSAHVDLRREGANLPPLAWSVCNANANVRK